jgi:hypothetical protein
VLAFDHAAAGQLIRSGDNGVLVPFGETAAFVAAAVALAAAPALREGIEPRALATARGLGWACVVARFEARLAAAGGAGYSRAAACPTDADRCGGYRCQRSGISIGRNAARRCNCAASTTWP